MSQDVLRATGLYVPLDRPDRVEKALASEADVVILDLEDAVDPGRKDDARAFLTTRLPELLARRGRTAHGAVQVRVNAEGTPWHDRDLEAVIALPAEVELRAPKIDGAGDVERLRAAIGDRRIHALLETPRGVEAAFEIAEAGVATIGLGEADLVSALGVADADHLTWQRARVINAAGAAGLAPPWMSVHTRHRDLDGLRSSCRTGRDLGFFGRAAAHPAQLPVIREAFTPSPESIARALELLEGLEGAQESTSGVWTLRDGSFADAAMVSGARRLLARAAATAAPQARGVPSAP